MNLCIEPETGWSKDVFLAGEELLVSAAQAGHDEAFVELCRRASGCAFGAIYRITKNHTDAEDVLQESILRSLLHLNQFKQDCSFSTWLTRIGINCALMLLRSRRARAEVSMEERVGEEECWHGWEMADRSENPETYYVRKEKERLLKTAVADLPTCLRSVVELRCDSDIRLWEIAAQVGVSLPAVKSRMARARRRLHESLEQQLFLRE
jgi:RNA polymerase sigma-70 factor (ECF subfamily)